MKVFKRWRFLLFATVAVFTLAALAACGDDDDSTSNTPTGAATASGAASDMAPADQQKLITQSAEPQFFDPHRSNFEQDIAVERMLFRGLYILTSQPDGSAKPLPEYATADPTVSADGKVFTVKIKTGQKWSDGQPVTAQNFVDGIIRGCDPQVASPYSYLLQSAAAGGIIGVVGCDALASALGTAAAPKTPTDAELTALKSGIGAKAVDANTLEVTLVDKALVTTFENIFSLWVSFPARADVIAAKGDKWTDPANIVVNGPFTLTEYVAKDHVTLKPNPNYGLDKKANLQELTIKFIDDLGAAYRAYQTGELDQTRIPDTETPSINANSELKDQLLIVGSGRITTVETLMTDPVLSKDKVRLALSQAIDRDTMSQVTTSGVGLPAEYWLVKGLPGYQGRDKFKATIGYNPTAAKQTLADAGYPNGDGFPTLELLIVDNPVRKAQADFLKKAFKDNLNIDISIKVVDAKTRSAAFNSSNFQLFVGGWQLDYPDPENPIVGLFNTDGGNNKYKCSRPDIDAAMADASKATTFDAHVAAYQKVEDLIVNNLCGVIPYVQEGIPYMVNPKMGGIQANGTIDAGQPGNWCAECWYVKK